MAYSDSGLRMQSYKGMGVGADAARMPQTTGLRKLLVERLGRQGVEPPHMAGFLRELGKLLRGCPEIQPPAVNQRLQYLGWNDVTVDYQSVQLAAACLQDE